LDHPQEDEPPPGSGNTSNGDDSSLQNDQAPAKPEKADQERCAPTLEELPRDAQGKLIEPLSYESAIALLDEVPGLAPHSLKLLLAETGVDMRRFPDEKHFCSWARMCPGQNESAGKRKRSPTGKGNLWLRRVISEMAWAASHAKGSYLSSFYRRLAPRRGKKRAIIALGHCLLVIVYHMLAYGRRYCDLGEKWLDMREPKRVKNYCVKRLRDIGYQVKLTPVQDAA